MNRVLLAGLVGGLAGVAISACVVDREGAPCDTDDNCPRSQYCDLTNKCVELKPSLAADTACQLVMVTVSQKFSACVGGSPQSWLQEIFPTEICKSYTESITAGRETYAPMKLKLCRAAVLQDECADLATRKAGRMLADCPMLAGTVGPGASCATDKDCAEGFCDTSGGCLGSCKSFTLENVACGATDTCEPGTTCTSGTCKRYITSGACSADAGPCQPYSNYCAGGQCVPRLPAGSPGCDWSGANNFCQSNINCVGPLFNTRICQAGGAVDSVCPPASNACDKFLYCQQRDGGNFCTPLPGPGGGCGFSPPQGAQDLVLYCLQSWCNGTTCASFLADGASCPDSTRCGPLARCVNGACRSEFCR